MRRVDDTRANKIADFLINDNTATFPTNIVLGVPTSIIHHQEAQDGIISIYFEDFVFEEVTEAKKGNKNDRFRERKSLRSQKVKKYLPFRLFYAENKDYEISDCLFYFFNSVRSVFGNLWEYDTQNKPENVLQSTIGFEALMAIMADILLYVYRNISQRCDCCLKKGRIDFTEKLAFLGLTKDTVKLTNEGLILSRQQALYTMSD